MIIPAVVNMAENPKIVPKFLVPKYSLRKDALTGAIPEMPMPKMILNIIINQRELPSISQKRNSPMAVRSWEVANTYFLL